MRAAIYPLFPNVTIRASAGTGKTFQLSNRYISLVNAGESPERILAVTFTRKAAGEILDRILIRLTEAATSPDKLSVLQKHIVGPELDRNRCLDLLKTLLKHLHRMRVSTLDSFFLQIAGGLAFELGLPVGWQIVEDVDDQRLRVEAWRALLAADALADLVNLMRLLSKGEASRSVTALLASIATDLYDLAQQTDVRAWRDLSRMPPLAPEDLQKAIHDVASFNFTDGRFRKARDGDIGAASQGDWVTFVSKGLAKSIASGADTYYKKPIDSDVLNAYRLLLQHAQAVLIGQVSDQNEATRRVLDRFDHAYLRLKLRHRAFRFDDITRILSSKLTPKQLDHISYRLDAPVAHLLLDEFQDTSLVQWDAIGPFAESISKQEACSFFCVGDVKQAIYGWRGGVSELVETVASQLPNVTEERLNCSYRSSQIVIDTVNTTFGTLGENPLLSQHPDVISAWRCRFDTHTTVRSKLHGHCCLVTAPAPEEGEDQSTVTLRFAAAEVARLHRASPNRTIGVLVRRNKAVVQLIYELRHTHHIVASEEGGNPLLDSIAVQVILSLLRLADHPGDTMARFHVAYSPLGRNVGFDCYDDEAAVQRVSLEVRQSLMALGYGRTIYGWVKALADDCDQRELNRLSQLVELAYGYESRATERTIDFVAYVGAKKVEESTAAPVRVMTIHQAKGLQFDRVVLPELDVNLEGQPPSVVVGRTGPTEPIETVCRYVKRELRPLLPERFQEMFAAHTTQVVNEALCLLYVAMTRAVHALHMIIAPSRSNERSLPKTFAGFLRSALCGGIHADPETILCDHGTSDWHEMQTGQVTTDISSVSDMSTGEPEELTIRLRASETQRTRGLERLRPSHAKGGHIVRLAERLRPGATRAMARGSLLHAWLEQIEWLDDGQPEDATLHRVAQDFAQNGFDIEAEIQVFRRMLNLPQTHMALSRCGYGDLVQLGFSEACGVALRDQSVTLRVFRERPFAVREDNAIVNGIIDRLILFCRGDKVLAADILDYKSDALSVGDEMEMQEAVTRYEPQLASYRRAMAQQFGLDANRVITRLLFIQVGEVWRVKVS